MCSWKTSRTLNWWPTGILVKMLKKEKKKAQDAAAQLANITSGQTLTYQSASSVTTGSTDTISTNHGGRAVQYMKRGTIQRVKVFLNLNDLKAPDGAMRMWCITLNNTKWCLNWTYFGYVVLPFVLLSLFKMLTDGVLEYMATQWGHCIKG